MNKLLDNPFSRYCPSFAWSTKQNNECS